MESANNDITEDDSYFPNNDFLKEFYKECGREITLAFTTLNQMKNWAIVVTAALLATFSAIWKNSTSEDQSPVFLAGLIAASLSLLLNIRFFIRATGCYVNLIRWNQIQHAIISSKLIGHKDGKSLNELITRNYINWQSPVNRIDQITSTLEWGFGLLLLAPTMAIIFCGLKLWADPVANSILAFVALGCVIETYEFCTNKHHSNGPSPRERSSSYESNLFPGPSGRIEILIYWVLALAASISLCAMTP